MNGCEGGRHAYLFTGASPAEGQPCACGVKKWGETWEPGPCAMFEGPTFSRPDTRIEAALRSCLNSAREAVLPPHERNSATPAMQKAIDTTHDALAGALAKRDAWVTREAAEDLRKTLRDCSDLAREFLETLDSKYIGQIDRGDARPLREISQIVRGVLEERIGGAKLDPEIEGWRR